MGRGHVMVPGRSPKGEAVTSAFPVGGTARAWNLPGWGANECELVATSSADDTALQGPALANPTR